MSINDYVGDSIAILRRLLRRAANLDTVFGKAKPQLLRIAMEGCPRDVKLILSLLVVIITLFGVFENRDRSSADAVTIDTGYSYIVSPNSRGRRSEALPANTYRVPPLLRISKRCCRTDNTRSQFQVMSPWLTDQSMIHIDADGALYKYDLTTRSNARLTVETHDHKMPPASRCFVSPSPDGRWFLCWQMSSAPAWLVSADGKQKRLFSVPKDITCVEWCADSQSFLTLSFKAKATGFTLAAAAQGSINPGTPTVYFQNLPNDLPLYGILGVLSSDNIVTRTPDAIEWKPDESDRSSGSDLMRNFTVSFKGVTDRAKSTVITVWCLHSPVPLHQFRVILPGYLIEAELSPDGKRMAWLLTTKQEDVLGKTSGEVSLWVSSADGAGIHELGRMMPDSKFAPARIAWSPNGKSLSFNEDQWIWVTKPGG